MERSDIYIWIAIIYEIGIMVLHIRWNHRLTYTLESWAYIYAGQSNAGQQDKGATIIQTAAFKYALRRSC